MIQKTILKPVTLPGDTNPTAVETVASRALPTGVATSNTYWKAFSNGFVEGLALPFAALFGMAGCSDRETGTKWVKANGADDASGDGFGEVSKDSSVKTDAGAESTDTVFVEGVDDAEATDVAEDASTDICQEFCDAELADAPEEVALPDAVTEDVAPEVADSEEVFQDAAADIPEDATLTDAAEDVALPQDATADVTPDVYDSGICQYFCDTGAADTSDTSDVTLAEDATLSSDSETTLAGVSSKMCSGPAGTQTLAAPANSVAVACTNSTINALIQGAQGCVAECGYYDNNVTLSTDPNNPVKFAMNLFVPPQAPMQLYTITLTLQSPMFADGGKPGLPGFMGSSFVFAFNQKLYDAVGDIVWEAQDKDAKGAAKGVVQIKYQPQDFFFKLPEFLDITYVDLIGNKVSYRYPCDTLVDSQGVPNAIVNCTEVK